MPLRRHTRREIRSAADLGRMQKRAVSRLLSEFFDDHSYGHPEAYEFKHCEVRATEWGTCSVVMEVGRKDDEGTLGMILCRSYEHYLVGPRGKLDLMSSRGCGRDT
jgi:hypothetical protein